MKLLLDTHVWIWWNMNPQKLSKNVKSLISSPSKYEELLLSAISPWEFAKLIEKGRLAISCDAGEWISKALKIPKLRLVPLSPSIAYHSTILPKPFHDDPADQMIVATAREENATLLTADERILTYNHCRSTW
ncbi:MAG: type II toxin-antitoxin system VapC family toxin [Fibrobacteres bacterium]|nr:type II toxin-antitoxin system VapC family toxin [Fibrobacterota bacterium]